MGFSIDLIRVSTWEKLVLCTLDILNSFCAKVKAVASTFNCEIGKTDGVFYSWTVWTYASVVWYILLRYYKLFNCWLANFSSDELLI